MDTPEETLRRWENGREPHVASYPKIVEFLGVEPWPASKTLAQRLQAARKRRGITIAEAAVELGVDASTWWWWENGRKPHRIADKARLAGFLGANIDARANSPEVELRHEPPRASDGLGNALRSRRRELGWSIETAAKEIGVNVWTLLGWEHNRRTPTDRYYPALIRFLGFEPWPEPQTTAERLRAERLRRGFTQEQLAAVIQVNPDSISRWEAGAKPRHHTCIERIDAFLTGLVRPRIRRRPPQK